jgi:hypothetical protein
LTYTELVQAMRRVHPDRNLKSLSNDIFNLDRHIPAKVYKPVKGVYVHTRFKDVADAPIAEPKASSAARSARVPEEKFYALFAAWLKNDLEEVTVAIPLGGNAFRDRLPPLPLPNSKSSSIWRFTTTRATRCKTRQVR